MISENDALNKSNQTVSLSHDPLFFSSNLHDNLNSLQKHSNLQILSDKAKDEEQKDLAVLRNLDVELIRKLKRQKNQIKRYCIKQGIDLQDGIREFEDCIKGKEVWSGDLIDSLLWIITCTLSELLENFPLGEHDTFVQRLVRMNASRNILASKLDLDLIKWRNEKSRIERIKIGTFWYSWQQLMHFNQLYNNYEDWRLNAILSGKLFDEWQLCDDLKKISGIALGQQVQYMNELKWAYQKVFAVLDEISVLQQTLISNANANVKIKSANIFIGYDKDSGTLLIGDHKIVFPRSRRDSKVHKILEIITKDIESLHKKWTKYEIFSKLGIPINKAGNLRDYSDHIQNQCYTQSKQEITDFFKKPLSKNHLQIDSQYLQFLSD